MQIIRITENNYNYIKNACKRVYDYSREEVDGLAPYNIPEDHQYQGYMYYPSVEDLEKHRVRDNFKKYFNYLLYFHERFCHPYGDVNYADPKFTETLDYIDAMFDEQMRMITNEDLDAVTRITPEEWAGMSVEERTITYDGILYAYDMDEKEFFLNELEWMPFMRYYQNTKKIPVSEKKKREKEIAASRKDMGKVWDCYWN
ncbi:MAG: hypothetical protein K5744_09030 [Eubacterium sp.]|nr:hypothetical protein [Eubacterium sp.]